MNFSLLRELAITDFKLRYKGSFLGYLWSLLKPIGIFGTLYLVFSIFIRFDQENYAIFLLLGLLLWNTFAEATINGMNALITKANLLTKTTVKKTTIVLASNITTLITLLLNLVIFFVIMAFVKPDFSPVMFLSVVSIFELFIVGLGMSYALSVLYVYYRDFSSIWDIALQMGMWLTPIIYPLDIVPERFHIFFEFNPMNRIIREAREIIINLRVPDWQNMLITFGFAVLVYYIGLLIFKRKQANIAEEL